MSITGKPNILLLIADDLGADVTLVTDRSPQRAMYVMTEAGGPMILGELDVLSVLLRNGLYFDQAWAQPACSPTRGSLYTGTWPWRNGVGSPSSPALDPGLVTSLPELLGPEGYACGIFGKWHLGSGSAFWPTAHGWDLHVGTLGGVIGPGTDASYTDWEKETSADNYTTQTQTLRHATSVTVEEAGAWIRGLDRGTPWFCTLAFHAPHDPFHDPVYGYELPGGAPPATKDDEFNAMAQNMDHNIGRLLGLVDPGFGPAGAFGIDFIRRPQLKNTVILFTGDNGSHRTIALEEEKTKIYEGGVRVPMLIADGEAVVAEIDGGTPTPRFLAPEKLGRSSPKMVHVVDLYETIAEVAGVGSAALPADMDSKSIWRFPSQPGAEAPTRTFNFSQYYLVKPNNPQDSIRRATIRNETHKLNCEITEDASNNLTFAWSLYAYWGHEIPGLEDGTAADLFPQALADLQAGTANDDADNLDALLTELIDSGDYEIDDTTAAWADPR